jgi:hypothetical protein
LFGLLSSRVRQTYLALQSVVVEGAVCIERLGRRFAASDFAFPLLVDRVAAASAELGAIVTEPERFAARNTTHLSR